MMDEKLRNQALREYATFLRARSKADRETEARAENVARDVARDAAAASRAASRTAAAAAHPFVTAFVAFMKAYPEGLKDQDQDALFAKYHDYLTVSPHPQRQPEDSSQLKQRLREFTPVLRTCGWEVIERVSSRKIDGSWKSVRLLEITRIAPAPAELAELAEPIAAEVGADADEVSEVSEVSTITPADTDEAETPPRINSGINYAKLGIENPEIKRGHARLNAKLKRELQTGAPSSTETGEDADGTSWRRMTYHHSHLAQGMYAAFGGGDATLGEDGYTASLSADGKTVEVRSGPNEPDEPEPDEDEAEPEPEPVASLPEALRAGLKEEQTGLASPAFAQITQLLTTRTGRWQYRWGGAQIEEGDSFVAYTFNRYQDAALYVSSFEGDEDLTAEIDGTTVTIRLAGGAADSI